MTARPTDSTTTRQSDEVELDPFHGAVVDEVSASDAGRAALGEILWLRRAEPHELCMPGAPCLTWPAWVVVKVIAPGLRMRRALPADWLVAS